MRVVLLGPPGAGKGTRAQIIAGELGVPAISTGDILRADVSGGTDLGRQAEMSMDAGDLVPDEITVAMVSARLAEPDAARGFLLDGFPRTIPQAERLDEALAHRGHRLDHVLELVVDEDEVVRRLSAAACWSTASGPSARTTSPRRCAAAWRSTETWPRH